MTDSQQLDPNNPSVYCSMGYYHYRRGSLQKARVEFEKVVKMVPKVKGAVVGEDQERAQSLRTYAARALTKIADVLDFEVWLDSGERIDSSRRSGPLHYLHGKQNFFSGLDEAMVGCEVGHERSFIVPAQEGYGAQRPDRRC